MPWDGFATTLFKAIRRTDGKNVCVDADHLGSTTRVVRTPLDYDNAIAQGWVDHPEQAMARLEAEQDATSTDAAVRAYDDRNMSEKALAEASAEDSTSVQHKPEVPEAPKKGRTKKGG
jgi:hypothetical protein